jgi:hypothetical protein
MIRIRYLMRSRLRTTRRPLTDPREPRPEELPCRGSRSPDQRVACEVTSRGENASISTAWPAADEGIALTHPGLVLHALESFKQGWRRCAPCHCPCHCAGAR